MPDPVRSLGRRLLLAMKRGTSGNARSPLLDNRTLAEIAAQVGLQRHAGTARRETRYRHAGDFRSAHLGQGLDYEEARLYQPGDDVRAMDWRTTARTGKPYLKVYREDHDPALHLVIDRRAGMRFGTRARLKVTQAVRIAAVLAFDAGYSHASVGATLWEPGGAVVPAGGGVDYCLQLLRAASAPCPPLNGSSRTSQWTFAQLGHRLSMAVPRDARIVVVSDFAGLDQNDLPVLTDLATRYELHAVQVLDPAEVELPDIGPARFRHVGTGALADIDTADPAVRAAYGRWSAQRRSRQREWFAHAGVRLHQCTTQTDPFTLLQGIYGR